MPGNFRRANFLARVHSWVQKRLFLDWREHLTAMMQKRWLSNHALYRIKLAHEPDNPDQRIQEDCAWLSEKTIVLVKYFIMNLFKLIAFASILWGLSGVQKIELFGLSLEIHGYLVWVALVWSILCTLITHWIGRKLRPLNIERQHREADFRATLLRVRDSAEQVASLRGEATELERFSERFARIKENWLSLIKREFQLEAFTASYMRVNNVIAIMSALPLFLAKAMTFGDLMQARSAFSSVQDGFGWFLDYYKRIMEWAAVVDRLHRFEASLEEAQPGKAHSSAEISDGSLNVDSVALFTPSGRCLAKNLNLRPASHRWILIDGRSGAGKSTFLRALAGLWPFCTGRLSIPLKSLLFVPQKSYLPYDSLKNVLTYPRRGGFSDEAVEDALRTVGLERLIGRLAEKKNWAQELSGGEQQRIGLARVLLNRPKLLFLDESTNQLDDASALTLIRTIRDALPDAIVLMVTHQTALKNFADTRITVESSGPAAPEPAPN